MLVNALDGKGIRERADSTGDVFHGMLEEALGALIFHKGLNGTGIGILVLDDFSDCVSHRVALNHRNSARISCIPAHFTTYGLLHAFVAEHPVFPDPELGEFFL